MAHIWNALLLWLKHVPFHTPSPSLRRCPFPVHPHPSTDHEHHHDDKTVLAAPARQCARQRAQRTALVRSACSTALCTWSYPTAARCKLGQGGASCGYPHASLHLPLARRSAQCCARATSAWPRAISPRTGARPT